MGQSLTCVSEVRGLKEAYNMTDMATAACMTDHFDKIQKLPDPIPGCPNFRRVPGYKVYCCGQPTLAGLEAALEKVCGTIYPKDGPIIWFNMRQEPDVYINGQPVCARPPNKIGEYAELGNITRDIVKAHEVEFLKQVEGRKSANGGKLEVVDINKKKSEIEVKELKSLSQAVEGLKGKYPGLVHWRIPVCNSAAPKESDFDIICKTLLGTSINTPIIISDQVGLSRATTACVIACLFKEFQISASYEGLIETVPGVNATVLKTDKYVMDQTKDALFRGEFEVVKELVAKMKDGVAAKNNAGLSNLEGLAAKDFKGNLGQIIHDIYQTAHLMFNDMPQGDHKKRAKYRFASKTLMRILPEANRKEVEGLI